VTAKSQIIWHPLLFLRAPTTNFDPVLDSPNHSSFLLSAGCWTPSSSLRLSPSRHIINHSCICPGFYYTPPGYGFHRTFFFYVLMTLLCDQFSAFILFLLTLPWFSLVPRDSACDLSFLHFQVELFHPSFSLNSSVIFPARRSPAPFRWEYSSPYIEVLHLPPREYHWCLDSFFSMGALGQAQDTNFSDLYSRPLILVYPKTRRPFLLLFSVFLFSFTLFAAPDDRCFPPPPPPFFNFGLPDGSQGQDPSFPSCFSPPTDEKSELLPSFIFFSQAVFSPFFPR